jgi:predicted MFS family arabinose efflux permease
MNDRNLARGLFLMALSLAFGLTAFKYPIGDFARAGPGLFPVLISSLLFLIGMATVIRSRFVEKSALTLNPRNIGIILGSLIGFAVVTMFVNMFAAIVFMVFFATMAGSNYSWKRNVKISIGLCLMALVFAKLLGMNLPLY